MHKTVLPKVKVISECENFLFLYVRFLPFREESKLCWKVVKPDIFPNFVQVPYE